MGWLKRFWDTFTASLNPARYDKLDHRLSASFRYYAVMILFMILLTGVLFIPSLFSLPERVQQEMRKFDSLNVTMDYKLKEPIIIPRHDPILVIDVIDNPTPVQDGMFVINGDSFSYRPYLYGKPAAIRSQDNILETTSGAGPLFQMLVVLGIPVLLVSSYAYFFIKYLIIVVVASVIGFILTRVARFAIDYVDTFRIAIHASTIMAGLGLLTKPFTPTISYLEYIVFALFFLLGILKLGEFEEHGNKHEPLLRTGSGPYHKRGY